MLGVSYSAKHCPSAGLGCYSFVIPVEVGNRLCLLKPAVYTRNAWLIGKHMQHSTNEGVLLFF